MLWPTMLDDVVPTCCIGLNGRLGFVTEFRLCNRAGNSEHQEYEQQEATS